MPENKTTKPMSHVLVVSADPGLARRGGGTGINSAAQKLDNPFDLLAVAVADAAAAIAAVQADGDIQIILIDHGDHAPVGEERQGAPRATRTSPRWPRRSSRCAPSCRST